MTIIVSCSLNWTPTLLPIDDAKTDEDQVRPDSKRELNHPFVQQLKTETIFSSQKYLMEGEAKNTQERIPVALLSHSWRPTITRCIHRLPQHGPRESIRMTQVPWDVVSQTRWGELLLDIIMLRTHKNPAWHGYPSSRILLAN